MRDHSVVVDGFRIFAVEADFDRENACVLVGVGSDHLRFVVLLRRGHRSEPHLHAIAVRTVVIFAELRWREPAHRLAHFVEQEELHGVRRSGTGDACGEPDRGRHQGQPD